MKKITTFSLRRSLMTLAASAMMLLSSQSASAYTYTALSGTGGTGAEGYASLVDGNIKTKMGHSYTTGSSECWIIFKASEALIPTNYFLVTGGDSGIYTGRNWSSWNIYAGNYSSDAEATRESNGWILIDAKNNELLPDENNAPLDFVCSNIPTTAFQYFMIEVTECATMTDIWMQMAEFGFGTSAEFYGSSELFYTVIDGDRNDGSNEGLDKLFDGDHYTKWGNGITENEPQFAIFKANRPIAPTYYCLVTGNDNASWTGRNWKTWRIYGLEATSDGEATRDAAGWTLIDEHVESGELPDYNSYEVFFTPNQGNTTAYQYFKVEIWSIQSGGGYMQMCELYLGDESSLASDKKKHYNMAGSVIVDGKPCQKSVLDEFQTYLNGIMTAGDIFEVDQAYKKAVEMQAPLQNSYAAYENYVTIVNQLRNHYENHTCITGEGRTVIGNYLTTNAGPGSDYPNGTYQYIIDNGSLGTDAINKESVYVNMLLEQYAADLTEGAIETQYLALAGTSGFGGDEDYPSLVDGMDDTKWCSGNGDYFIVFRTDDGNGAIGEGIAPTYYRLFTGNDTGSYPDRNWNAWKIYGANFDSDEAATRESDAWVLLDEKSGITSAQLPDADFTAAFMYMSNPSDTKYTYFKIEVTDPTGTMQMGELTFGNAANFIQARADYYNQFSDADYTDVACYAGYVEQFNENLKALSTTGSIIELGTLYTNLKNLQTAIEESIENYKDYETAMADLRDAMSYMDQETLALMEKYCDEEVAPGEEFARGSYVYIISNHSLDNAGITAEISYIQEVTKAALEGGFILIGGTGGTWGDGSVGNLIDKNFESKWGGALQVGGSYVIFRCMEATVPLFYKLTTGNDTHDYSGRNWRNWQIYGANFNSDAEATADAEGWVLIDNREDIGQDRLPAENFYTVPFGFSEGVSEPYKYYKVVVTRSYDGGDAFQMTELEFGTTEEYNSMKDDYLDELGDFDTNVVAETALLEQYDEMLPEIFDAGNMEDLYNIYSNILKLRDQITESANSYKAYMNAVAEVQQYLVDTPLEESEALATLKAYMNDIVEPDDQFLNGSYKVIIDEHTMTGEQVIDEIDFLTSLQAAAVAKGYTAGAEITSMIINPSFAKGNEGWDGEVFSYGTNIEKTMSAAEFCEDKAVFNISQTLTGLKNGLYEVRINGGFRPCGDVNSNNYAAVLYANGNATYLQTVLDDMIPVDQAVDRENCYLEGDIADKAITTLDGDQEVTLGYVIWGVQGSCYAFQAGRYQNSIVATVTDGTLTFGVKNDGTGVAGDWTGLGNARVIYLGELGSDLSDGAMDRALAGQNKIVATLENYNSDADTGEAYKSKPYVNLNDLATLRTNLESAPATAAAKYAIIEKNTDLFYSIYDTKVAYIEAIDAHLLVQSKWEEHMNVMSTDEQNALMDAIYSVLDGCSGVYSASEAIAAKKELFEKYPCYLEFDAQKTKGNMDFTEESPFVYHLTANGNRPNIGLNKVTYEPLTEDETIVTFEYTANTKVESSSLYFANPSVVTTKYITFGDLEPATEWTRVYIDIADGIQEWGWGSSTTDWFRWELSKAGTFEMDVRNIQIITRAKMEEQGGQTINAINSIVADRADTGIYTLTGVRVEKPTQKGIYIMNGRKVFVR